MIHGPSGIGKTAMTKHLSRSPQPFFRKLRKYVWGSEEPVAFVNVRAAQLEPTDLGGLPYLSKNLAKGEEEDGPQKEIHVTRYATPAYMPGANPLLPNKGILCLDEFFRAVENTMQAMFELIEIYEDPHTGLMCHKIGDNYLPSGWHVIALTNPVNSGNFVQNPMNDRALYNRFAHIWYGIEGMAEEYTTDWLSYISNKIISLRGDIPKSVENVLGVAHSNPKMLFGEAWEEKNAGLGMDISPCPAGWEKVSRIAMAHEDDDAGAVSKDAFHSMIRGTVGDNAFKAYLSANLPVRPSDIINIGRQAWRGVLSSPKLSSRELSAMVAVIHSFIPSVDEEENKALRRKKMTNFCDFLYDVTGKYNETDSKSRSFENREIVSMIMRDILKRDLSWFKGSENKKEILNNLNSLFGQLLDVGYDLVIDFWRNHLGTSDENIGWLLVLDETIQKGRKKSPRQAEKIQEIICGVMGSKLFLDIFSSPENEEKEE